MVFNYILVIATYVPSLDVPEQQTSDVEFITFFCSVHFQGCMLVKFRPNRPPMEC